jgi:hypothetical protein
MGIPLKAGRLFRESDARSAPHVALISEALARRRFAGLDPIGQRVEFGNMDGDLEPMTVVGVVGDVRQQSLEAAPEPLIYANLRQRPQKTYRSRSSCARTATPRRSSRGACGAARDRPAIPPRFRRLEQVVADSLAARRFSLTLLFVFGGLALLLATSGIASVTAFSVARRRPELGIRLALGRARSDLLRHVVSRHLAIIVGGGAAGLAVAAALAAVLRGPALRRRAVGPVELRREPRGARVARGPAIRVVRDPRRGR